VAFVAIAAGATLPFYPLYHVPWLLFALVGLVLWRRSGGRLHPHDHSRNRHDGGRPSSVMDH
jgi:hypothetical protein